MAKLQWEPGDVGELKGQLGPFPVAIQVVIFQGVNIHVATVAGKVVTVKAEFQDAERSLLSAAKRMLLEAGADLGKALS